MHPFNHYAILNRHLLWADIEAQGRRRYSMKQGIHPEYHTVKVHCITCGNEFESKSTAKEIRVDTCSNCHPYYTGKQRFAQAAGRVEKFNRKYGVK